MTSAGAAATGASYKPREDGYPAPRTLRRSLRAAAAAGGPGRGALRTQMRVAAAEMAAAAAEFVQLGAARGHHRRCRD